MLLLLLLLLLVRQAHAISGLIQRFRVLSKIYVKGRPRVLSEVGKGALVGRVVASPLLVIALTVGLLSLKHLLMIHALVVVHIVALLLLRVRVDWLVH